MKKLKRLTLACVLLFSFGMPQAQIFDPVKWDFSTEHVQGNESNIVFHAEIEPGWAVYSQYLERDDGPIATSIVFEKGGHFALTGKAIEDPTTKKEGHDPMFDMNLAKYFKSMIIKQRVRIEDFSTPVAGIVTFMTCDDERCLPPAEVDFFLKFQWAPKQNREMREVLNQRKRKKTCQN